MRDTVYMTTTLSILGVVRIGFFRSRIGQHRHSSSAVPIRDEIPGIRCVRRNQLCRNRFQGLTHHFNLGLYVG